MLDGLNQATAPMLAAALGGSRFDRRRSHPIIDVATPELGETRGSLRGDLRAIPPASPKLHAPSGDHQNPKQNVNELKQQLRFSILLIDATNKDYLIRKFENGANKIAIPHYTLKKNKAYLVELTQ